MVPDQRRPPTNPIRITRGLEGYAHRARSRAPSGKETQPSLTWPRPPLGLVGLPEPRAPNLRRILARPLAPAQLTMPAKAQEQEDKPQAIDAEELPGAAP
jgi:hypothetical protein